MSITVSGDAYFSPGAASEDVKRHFKDRGFVVIEGALPEDMVTEVKAEIQAILDTEADRHLENSSIPRNDQFDAPMAPLFRLNSDYGNELYDTLQNISGLYKIIASRNVLETAENLGLRAPNVRAKRLQIVPPSEDNYLQHLNARTGLQKLHQDTRNIRTERNLNFRMPLTDVTAENGALEIYPESHENGLRSTKNTDEPPMGYDEIADEVAAEYEEVLCTIDPGDLLIFHTYLFHRATTNQSNSTRCTIAFNFDDATDIPWMIDGENPYDVM